MKRPEQHVTESQADALFQALFAKWSVNGSKRDYGWDYVVEVFRDGQSTGFLFEGQLKGSHRVFGSGPEGIRVGRRIRDVPAKLDSRQE